ncbi:hypothetical protein BLA24_32040 [Streptomyces cinnamoneus]|uniref:Uncharacterized protein n=1 Tax=Streptomyces cinnamoneus TaxID=53446 RepID=A0A2G1XA23_STRCJ|nr:hypothetical protein [Streptomyces cinnamoneus]PHQ48076.1 hypothetical protein BLA24_32040 [Streptomyces cinnamoneus]PPT15702.1 hypothetical protein CYQ11_25095 [Streptomyces cinnamoneus]
MSTSIDQLVERIRGHRCYDHPVFDHWTSGNPTAEVVGALFHQIQKFCAVTRPGGRFPEALTSFEFSRESKLLQEIVESEEDHGPELATMAGYILNRAAGRAVFADLDDQQRVEAGLKEFSDKILGSLPGYDPTTGLLVQTRKAMAVFDGRQAVDKESTLRNLGTALALEMISNRQLIPGEKRCLVDSGLYRASLDDPEMHYLLEHWGEIGAEQMHEENAIAAVGSVLNEETEELITEGVDAFLDNLANLWDVLDSALLASGHREAALTG